MRLRRCQLFAPSCARSLGCNTPIPRALGPLAGRPVASARTTRRHTASRIGLPEVIGRAVRRVLIELPARALISRGGRDTTLAHRLRQQTGHPSVGMLPTSTSLQNRSRNAQLTPAAHKGEIPLHRVRHPVQAPDSATRGRHTARVEGPRLRIDGGRRRQRHTDASCAVLDQGLRDRSSTGSKEGARRQTFVAVIVSPSGRLALWSGGPCGRRGGPTLPAGARGDNVALGPDRHRPVVLEDGDPLGPKSLATYRLPLGRHTVAYATFHKKEGGCIKVVLKP